MRRTRVVVIAKAPLAGFAKTRLIPALGPEGAAQLARRMLDHAVRTALDADVGPVELCVTPGPGDPAWRSVALPAGLAWHAQGDGDLGARMARPARAAASAGDAVVLIGTDCPALTVAHLREAVRALERHDAALLPTHDGGYALLALARFHARLFDDMPWSTAAVGAETLRRVRELGWTAALQPALHDIDEPADLARLPAGWLDGVTTSTGDRSERAFFDRSLPRPSP